MTNDEFESLDNVLQRLRATTPRDARSLRNKDVYPPATLNDVAAAERELGFEIPPLLKRVYLEIGNGGAKLGPGFGLLGLPGGYDNHDGWGLVVSSLEMSRDYPWWDLMLVLCDWGCCERSCVDCSDDDYTVYRFDGNHYDPDRRGPHPSERYWSVEADTLQEWLLTPNCS